MCASRLSMKIPQLRRTTMAASARRRASRQRQPLVQRQQLWAYWQPFGLLFIYGTIASRGGRQPTKREKMARRTESRSRQRTTVCARTRIQLEPRFAAQSPHRKRALRASSAPRPAAAVSEAAPSTAQPAAQLPSDREKTAGGPDTHPIPAAAAVCHPITTP